jgi:hypothetical protein
MNFSNFDFLDEGFSKDAVDVESTYDTLEAIYNDLTRTK